MQIAGVSFELHRQALHDLLFLCLFFDDRIDVVTG